MLKKVLSLLIVLMLMLATAGPAVAIGDDMHMEDDVGSGEGDPGGGDTSPAKDDDLNIFQASTAGCVRIVFLPSRFSPWFGFVIDPVSFYEDNTPTLMHSIRVDVSNVTGDK